MSGFEFDGGQHAKRGGPALSIVEDLEVAEDLGSQLDRQRALGKLTPVEFELAFAPTADNIAA